MANILWIDNDPRRFSLIDESLSPSDVVFFAWGSAQIAHYLKHANANMFLIDYDMDPMLNGIEVVNKFSFPDRPIVCCSLRKDKAEEMASILKNKGHDKVYIVPAKPGVNFESVLSLIHDSEGGADAVSSWIGELLPPKRGNQGSSGTR